MMVKLDGHEEAWARAEARAQAQLTWDIDKARSNVVVRWWLRRNFWPIFHQWLRDHDTRLTEAQLGSMWTTQHNIEKAREALGREQKELQDARANEHERRGAENKRLVGATYRSIRDQIIGMRKAEKDAGNGPQWQRYTVAQTVIEEIMRANEVDFDPRYSVPVDGKVHFTIPDIGRATSTAAFTLPGSGYYRLA